MARLICAVLIVLSVVLGPSTGFARAKVSYDGLWEGTMQCGSSHYTLHLQIEVGYLSRDDHALMDIYEQRKPEKVGRVRLDLERRHDGFILSQETWMSKPVGALPFMTELINTFPYSDQNKGLQRLKGRIDGTNRIVFQPHTPECKQFEIKRTHRKLPVWRSNKFLAGHWSGTADKKTKKSYSPPTASMNLHAVGEKNFAGKVTFQYTTVDIDVSYDDRYKKFKFISSGRSINGKGIVLAGGHSRMMYLKTNLKSPYGSMYLVKIDPLAELGGLYQKYIDDFNSTCGGFVDWLGASANPSAPFDLKARFPVLLRDYDPYQSQIQSMLREDIFVYRFGKKPIELGEQEWQHILWVLMDCAKYSQYWARLRQVQGVYEAGALADWEKEAPARYSGSFVPEMRLKTSITPKDMMRLSRNIVNSRGVMADVLNKAKTVNDSANGVEEFRKIIIENSAQLTYALPWEVERFMMNAMIRLPILKAAAVCAKKYGLEVCRLPQTDPTLQTTLTPDDMAKPPLSKAERKHFEEIMKLEFDNI